MKYILTFLVTLNLFASTGSLLSCATQFNNTFHIDVSKNILIGYNTDSGFSLVDLEVSHTTTDDSYYIKHQSHDIQVRLQGYGDGVHYLGEVGTSFLSNGIESLVCKKY